MESGVEGNASTFAAMKRRDLPSEFDQEQTLTTQRQRINIGRSAFYFSTSATKLTALNENERTKECRLPDSDRRRKS